MSAHSDHLLDQLTYQLRSFLIHQIYLSLISPKKLRDESKGIAEDPTVLVSKDARQGTAAVPNIVIVAVGSYLLYSRIGLEFLAPFLVALIGILIPSLLSKPLAPSQKQSLEAAESRIKALDSLISEPRSVRLTNLQMPMSLCISQARHREIQAEKRFRLVLIVVFVVGELFCLLQDVN